MSNLEYKPVDSLDYGRLFAVLPERYVVLDNSYMMVEASKAYLKVTGKTKAGIIGKNIFEVFPDTSELALKTGKGALERSFEAVISTKKPDTLGTIRYDITDKSGKSTVRYWQATHYPIKNAQGDVTHIVQSTTDMTDLVESSQRRKIAELHLDDAMHAGLIGSWTWDIQNDVIVADKALARLFGISEKRAASGLPLSTFTNSIHPDDRVMVAKKIEVALQSGEFECEYRTIDAKKQIRWVIARGRVEKDSNGKPIEFPGVMIDITSRKQAETELIVSEERFRFMADAMPQLVWITRPDGYHEYYNQQWYDFTGTKPGSTDGEGWNDLFHPDDQKRAWEIWRHSLKTGEQYEIRYRLYHAPTKLYRWVIGRALPYCDESGAIIKWYGTCTDIDDSVRESDAREKLQAELKDEKARLEARVAERTSQLKLTNEGLRGEIKKRKEIERLKVEQLTDLNKRKDEFISIASHQLRTPATAVKQYLGMLLEGFAGDISDTHAPFLKRANDNNERQLAIINDILRVAQLDAGRAVITKTKTDLVELVSSAIRDVTSMTNQRQQIISAILPKQALAVVDSELLRMVLDNLLDNASKYSHDHSHIDVSLRHDKGCWTIAVKDNGVGVTDAEQLFQKFSRIDNTLSTKVGGSGLGLYWAQSIARQHGGDLLYASNVGGGSIFSVVLPTSEK